MNKYIIINVLARPVYKKCSCCERILDLFYQVNIKAVKRTNCIQGSLWMCKECGDNINDALGNEKPANETVVKTFDFNNEKWG